MLFDIIPVRAPRNNGEDTRSPRRNDPGVTSSQSSPPVPLPRSPDATNESLLFVSDRRPASVPPLRVQRPVREDAVHRDRLVEIPVEHTVEKIVPVEVIVERIVEKEVVKEVRVSCTSVSAGHVQRTDSGCTSGASGENHNTRKAGRGAGGEDRREGQDSRGSCV